MPTSRTNEAIRPPTSRQDAGKPPPQRSPIETGERFGTAVVAPLYTTCWGMLKQPDNQKAPINQARRTDPLLARALFWFRSFRYQVQTDFAQPFFSEVLRHFPCALPLGPRRSTPIKS